MDKVTKEQVQAILKTIMDPESGKDIVSQGMVSAIVIKEGNVGFALQVAKEEAASKEVLCKECENAVKAIPGVEKVTVALTASVGTNILSFGRAQSKAKMEQHKLAQSGRQGTAPIPGVRHIVAVASGKGGVGKSTVSVNLAVALAQQGHKVGLVDADIFGPSVPRMLGINEEPRSEDKKLFPPENFGVKTISMGYLVPEDVATVWRGPMVTKTLFQLFRATHWGELDVLLVDLPPGTGDVQLSIAENFPVAGVVVVSTPQSVALADARKAINMCEKVKIPVLGMIENMSYFKDPSSGNKSYIFGKDGAKLLAAEMGIELLGQLPLEEKVRIGGDKGRPAAINIDKDGDRESASSSIAGQFDGIAQRIWSLLS